ncbi:aminopeptidase [Bacteroidia bacterium]|nr:aminopeptidase [Bacteroidia bacterium]
MNRKRYFYTVLIALICSSAGYAQKANKKTVVNFEAIGLQTITKQSVEAQLAFLASDALQGRKTGTQGGLVAAEYIKATLKDIGVKPFFNDYFQSFEAYAPARERRGDFEVAPDSIAKYKHERFYRRLNLRNVVGFIEGQNKDEFVVLGGHYDHVGVDELLVGDHIYNGADDNASSVVGVLQAAKAYVASGEKPLRTIIFALWDGEEVNYLGSEYFISNFKNPYAIKAYINLDMIAHRGGYVPILYPEFNISAPNAENSTVGNQFHLLYTKELTASSEQLTKAIAANKLNIEPKPGVLEHGARGSDQLSFTLRHVPFLWFFTGLHPDYHTPIDDIDHIDLDKLTEITKAVYLSVEALAKE